MVRMVIDMEKYKSVSAKLTEYIMENQLSINDISRETGVAKEKLNNKDITLNATEFLEVCAYLNIQPEELREKV